MSARTPSTSSARVFLDTPPPKNTRLSNVQPNRLPVPHTTSPSKQLQSIKDDDARSIMSQYGETGDEYTLSAYGDISLSEVQVPPLPKPTHPNPSTLQSAGPRPRLRLRVRRPPMPKHRMSFTYVPDPLPFTGAEYDERWPGSPRPIVKGPHRLQPLVSPVTITPASSLIRPMGPNDGSSFFEGLSPSIPLSPPGLPTNGARSNSGHVRSPSGRDDAVKVPQVSPVPAPRQDKPWRTRLPPRLPIPKWDM